MANTNVVLVFAAEGGVYVPSVSSVSVVSGDSVSFSTSDGSAAQLFFSPGALGVVSPASANPVSIPAGGTATFTFTSSAPGAYSVFFEPAGQTPGSNFPAGVSQQLQLEIDVPANAPGFQNNPLVKG